MTFRSGLIVFALFLTVSVMASAQRFGGSGNQAGQRAAQPPADTQAVRGQTAQPQAGSQAQNNGANRQTQGQQEFVGWEWWKDDEVRRELKLTDQVVRSIQRKYEDRARVMKPIDEAYKKERDELNRMSRERTVDVATYSIQVNRVDGLRSELNKTRIVMLYEFYRMLTPEQYLKFREIQDRRYQRSGRSGAAGSR